MICAIAAWPDLRSMVIGEASANAQPKNGIDSSSFLATKASGGNRKLRARVSQVDECLDMMMCGDSVAGMFSLPTTCSRMPQIQREPNRLSQHQPMMNLKRATGGSQNSSRTMIAQMGVTTSW